MPEGKNEEEEGVKGARPAGGSVLHLKQCVPAWGQVIFLSASPFPLMSFPLHLPLCCWHSSQPIILFYFIFNYKNTHKHTAQASHS